MMSIVCIGLGLSCAVLGYKWIQAERKASKLYDMATKALDQRDKVREELKEAKEMIELQQAELAKAKQEAKLYNILLCDVWVAYHSDEFYVSYKEITEEHTALVEGKTTGYFNSDFYPDELLEGYELVVGSNVIDLSEYRNRR